MLLLSYLLRYLPLPTTSFWIRETSHSIYFTRLGSYIYSNWRIEYFDFNSIVSGVFVCMCASRWPFDWETPVGYFVAWQAQFFGMLCCMAIAISGFNIIFGSSWLFIVIAEDITNDVAKFNANTIKITKNCDRAELMERFCYIIQNYSDAKESVSILLLNSISNVNFE